jgi:DNA-binding NarL/FixJ family response regulator
MSFTVLLIEDHPVVRQAYRQQIETLSEASTVLCAGSLTDAFRLLDEHPQPDLVLVDLNLPDASGTATIGALRNRAPTLRVAALSGVLDSAVVQACRTAGACGYLPKTFNHEQFQQALRQLQAGRMSFPELAGRSLVPAGAHDSQIRIPVRAEMPSPASWHAPRSPAIPGKSAGAPPDARLLGLTDRQRGVLRLMLQGLPNKAICRELALAEGTVKVHVSAVLRALGVSTRAQVVVAAMRSGIRLEDVR